MTPSTEPKKRDVSISGIGCLCALGNSLPDTMDSLFAGKSNSAPPTLFSTDRKDKYPVFEVQNEYNSSQLDSTSLGRTSQLALLAAQEALADAGLTPEILSGSRVGVCVGTTVGSSLNNETFYKKFRQGKNPDLSEVVRFLKSNPAEAIARKYNLSGPVQTVVNACSSGTDAIGIGRSWLKMGLCDLVIAGGSDELSRISYLGFISLFISDRKSCRPFSDDRNGLNLGEGAAMLVLSPPDENRSSYCKLTGYESFCDAHHLTAPHPEGTGLTKVLTNLIARDKIDSSDVSFINAHGTGTHDNDKVEMLVLSKLFPGQPYFSVKGGTGHTLGAAGAIEAAITASCIQRQEIPASIGYRIGQNHNQYPPTINNMRIGAQHAISQSLAFGGNNSALLFSK